MPDTEYTLKVVVKDRMEKSDYKTIKQKTDKQEDTATIANAPDISGFTAMNTFYVTWDLTSSTYTIKEKDLTQAEPNNWYDYTAGVNKWANVKTAGGNNDCYWVWIPRYAYKVPSKSKEGTIEIKFLNGKSNIPIGEKEEITNKTATEGNWVVHPAFTNEGNGGFGELTGIWVAKFEASSSKVSEENLSGDLNTTGGGDVYNLQVRVKPNVTSWRQIGVNNIFKVCKNLTEANNSLCASSNTSNTKIDSHMMKNTEWGAIAYLSRSIYGKNGNVWNNPFYTTSYYSPITGLCGHSYNEIKNSYENLYKYNEIGGGNASTTGNVYGVYDMAGGSWEYMAGIYESKRKTNKYDFSDAKYNKYFDWYTGYNNTKYGDAVYETSTSSTGETAWGKVYSSFPYIADNERPVFARGGMQNGEKYAGIFAFWNNNGSTGYSFTFRPCLIKVD